MNCGRVVAEMLSYKNPRLFDNKQSRLPHVVYYVRCNGNVDQMGQGLDPHTESKADFGTPALKAVM